MSMANPQAEWAVVNSMLAKPQIIGEIAGTQLEAADFTDQAARAVYAATLDRFYANDAVDALIVSEVVKRELAMVWGTDEADVPMRLQEHARGGAYIENVLDHAQIVRRLSTTRQLSTVASEMLAACETGKLSPSEIGDRMSSESLRITSGTAKREELQDWMDVGRNYLKRLAHMRKLRAEGKEWGVYTGLDFMDDWTKGIGPGELCFLAGEAGSGKSALAWECVQGFGRRQLQRTPEDRVATLLVSLEMGDYPTGQRFATGLTHIDGTRLREADISDHEYRRIVQEWKSLEGLPVRMNFASNFRLSQLRALIVEGIRRYNVGFIVIDHFRMIDPDKPIESGVERDEAKVRFLKEQIAKDLNVAVLCLAHTIKVGRGAEGGARPRLSDLRGSGQISAAADLVGFLHRPHRGADDDRFDLDADPTDAELVWAKNRYGTESVAPFRFEPKTMEIGSRYPR